MNSLQSRLFQSLGRASCIALYAGAVFLSGTASAADALNGKTLYLNGPTGGGTSCTACHGASPALNVNGILRGANSPTVISSSWAANKGGMGSLYNGKFSTAEIADLAAYIGNPGVTAGPVATLSPASLSFGGTSVGQSSDALAATLSNTGTANLNISNISITGANVGDFSISGGSCASGGSVNAGASCTVQVGFKPATSGARAASLVISHNGTGGSSTASLSGTGNALPLPSIALSASSINFAAVLVNTQSAVQTVTVSNSGQAALNFSGISLAGSNAAIFKLGGTCSVGTPLAAGGSCTVTAQAQSGTAGSFAAAINIASNASNASNGSTVINLTASATAATPVLTAAPTVLAFGSQTLASSTGKTITLTNTGNVALNISSITISGNAAFSVASVAAGSTCANTLAVAASCNVVVNFSPVAEGDVTANVLVASNAGNTQLAVSGTGTAKASARPVLSEAGPISFADTQVGKTSAVHSTSLSNTGSAALKITSLVLSGSQLNDFVLGGTCAGNASVSPAGSCTIETSFKPGAAGKRSADVLLVTDSGAQLSLNLLGNGVAVPSNTASLSVSPQSFDFGSVTLGSSAVSKRFVISNTGSSAVSLNSLGFSGAFSIAASTDTAACPALPFVLQAGASCGLTIQFNPAVTGTANGSASIQTNDAATNLTLALTGAATAAIPAVQSANVVSNSGGGGCTSIQDGNDPMLAVLVLLAAAVLIWRRRQVRQIANKVQG